ncbi:MAG: DUF4255 domain-containing protein [Vicinamibacterales bacterium]
MATADALRDLGDTLVFLLRAGIPALDPAKITVATPDEFEALRDPSKPNITIFLYRIAVNPEMRNSPRRLRPDGSTQPTPLPLELSFLVTAWAKDTRDELKLIGRILQVLYDRRELGAADLVGASWEPDDSVQLSLESLPLEDHYRIWDANDVPYRLSLTYLARVVGLTSSEITNEAPVVDARFNVTVN